MNWYHWAILTLTIFYIPILAIRGFRMGILGMWMPKPCPAATPIGHWKVKCCEHNPCPDRPKAKGKYRIQPWRCPQCKGWWITEGKNKWVAELRKYRMEYEWLRASEQVGDTFIVELQ